MTYFKLSHKKLLTHKEKYDMLKHDMDALTDYCLICGAAASFIMEKQIGCIKPNQNIIAISHIIAKRRFNEILHSSPKNNDPPS